MIAAYFKEETRRLADHCLADVATLEDWKAKRPVFRRRLLDMLGLDPLPPKSDLRPSITGRIDHDEFIVEKLHFQSLPGLYVTANLYVPKNLAAPAPAILYACGHASVKKNGVSYGNKVSYQHHPVWFTRHGYVCLIIDSVQLGEIGGIHHGTYRENMWWWNCRGYTPAGVETYNCIRALDYLETRPEVDADRIGMTGRSGGGDYTWLTAAIDERIKVVVPVAGLTDLQNHVVDGCVEGHCDCMYPVNTYRWDFSLLAALIAPRPLLICNSDKDRIFPLDGVIRVHEKVRRIYRLYGADSSLGLQISEGPHKDTQELQVAAFRWLNRFLRDDQSPIEKAAVRLFEPEQLRAFTQLPADQINTTIQEHFVAKAAPAVVPATMSEWAGLREGWMEALRTRCFAGWPGGDPEPLDVRLVHETQNRGVRSRTYEYTSQHHTHLPLYVYSPGIDTEIRGCVLNVCEPPEPYVGGEPASRPETEEKAFGRFRRSIIEAGLVRVYAPPRGVGPTAWNQKESRRTHIRRRFMLLGQTLDGMRVWDVRRAIQALRTLPALNDLPLQVEAEGNLAGVALYASLFESGIARLELTDLPASHRAGPIFLNVLRYLDAPQAVAMAAERTEVVLQQTSPEPWAYPLSVAARMNWPANRLQVSSPTTRPPR